MKQTQTKYFSFDDVGLDFCAASGNLIMDRFKKMLVTGYNENTVSAVSVTDSTVVFTYSAAHGYVEDRVLKVTDGPLVAINGGEFRIDSVTTNTVTMTIEGAPGSVSSGFNTKVAPLGWELVFELNRVHVFKYKSLDETDLYARFFYSPISGIGAIFPCVGASYDNATGFITDPYADQLNKDILTYPVSNNLRWMTYNYGSGTGFANYTYAQGVAQNFGRGMIVGSKYHFALLNNLVANNGCMVNALIPANLLNYPSLKLPVIFGASQNLNSHSNQTLRILCGALDITLYWNNSTTVVRYAVTSANSYLPTTIDADNTTAAFPPIIREYNTQQVLGMGLGCFICGYALNNQPTRTANSSPAMSIETDFSHRVITHGIGPDNGPLYFAFPIEEIKYVT